MRTLSVHVRAPRLLQLHPFLKNTRFRNPAGDQLNLDDKRKRDMEYDIINFWNFPEGLRHKVKSPQSVCSESCRPGFRKTPQEGKPACCFDCTPCPENEMANDTDMETCVKCPNHQYANTQRTHCLHKSVTFLAYEDPLGKVLAGSALSLTILTAAILGLFVKHRDTPIVKANNRGLSYTLLGALTFCFLCSLLFIGRPNTATCVLQQTTFGVGFTVAVSTVLAKTLTVVLAFKVTAPGRRVRQLLLSGAPNSIIPICCLLQITLCGIWMGTNPPFIDTDTQSEHGHIIIVCNKGSLAAFHCVLGYLGSLALGSFTVAFLARNLPDVFNEAKFLTFSTVVFCSVWLTFLPVYHSTKGKLMVAMEVFSILASSAGLLGCIFVPKCYVILLRPERNSLPKFRDKTHSVESSEGALVAHDDDVAVLGLGVRVNEGRVCSHPDPTESDLEQAADGDVGVWCPRQQQLPHSSAWSSDLEGQNHSESFGQHSGNGHREAHPKCGLLQDAGGRVGTANEEQGAEETEGEGAEQGVTQAQVIGLDDGGVSVLHKESKDGSCEDGVLCFGPEDEDINFKVSETQESAGDYTDSLSECGFSPSMCNLAREDCLLRKNPIVRKSGDVVIGGFFSLYTFIPFTGDLDIKPTNDFLLVQFMSNNYQNVLAFIFAIEEINRDSHLLPNISLGYEFHNFQHSHWRILESSLILLTGQDEIPNYICRRESKSAAVLTGMSWVTAAQIETLLELYKFPQLMFGSFDPMLKDNGQFPSVYQMAAKDTSLALGMVSLMLHLSWSWNCPPNASLAWLPVNRFDMAMSDRSYNIYNAVYAVAHTLHEMLLQRVTVPPTHEEVVALSFWKTPHSVCSDSCRPGFRKTPQEGKPACCFDCTPCSENEIANDTDMELCVKCPDHQYANIQRNYCLQKSVTFLDHKDPLGKALSGTALSLTILTAFILGLFIKHRDSPVVKANNRGLSYILLVSLTLCFLCSLIFIGRPNKASCILQQTMFGLVFTVAISTVLAKTITVVLAFKATGPGRRIRQLLVSGAPNCIIPICFLIQLTLCGVWMGTNPPFIDSDAHSEHGHIIIVCNKGSLTAFYCVLGYLGSLALSSFTVAFLARNLPDTFNEAKFLTFSMVVFCSVWITFLPVYHSTKGKVMVAMEVFSILASSAGLLGCIFVPKCYIILLRPHRNSPHALREKKYSERNKTS
ncbi:uncharacterized protein ACOB6Z_006980 [Ctenodactylus gundi]